MTKHRHLSKANRKYIELQALIRENNGVECEKIPEFFFPMGEEQHIDSEVIKIAKEICNQCPIRIQCLDYALTANEEHGIWGALTPQERRTLGRFISLHDAEQEAKQQQINQQSQYQ